MQRTTPLSPAYAMGFTALLRSLHQQLPTLLAEPPDLSIAANDVVLRGLLRERLAAGKPPSRPPSPPLAESTQRF